MYRQGQGPDTEPLSLFDAILTVLLAGMLALGGASVRFEESQAVLFCAGSLTLWAIAQMQPMRRQFQSAELGGLAIVAIATTLLHWPPTDAVVVKYFHLYALLAGALYVFCGCLLVILTAAYANERTLLWTLTILAMTNALWPYPGLLLTPSQSAFLSALAIPIFWSTCRWFIPVSIWNIWNFHSATALLAVLLTGIALCLLQKEWGLAGLLAIVGAMVVAFLWPGLVAKFACRVETWPMILRELAASPWIGQGMDTSLMSPAVLTSQGWVYRHNDLLTAARDFGVCIIPFAIALMYKLWRGASLTQRSTVMIAGLVMFCQTQAVFPRMMLFVCVIIGWCAMRPPEKSPYSWD